MMRSRAIMTPFTITLTPLANSVKLLRKSKTAQPVWLLNGLLAQTELMVSIQKISIAIRHPVMIIS